MSDTESLTESSERRQYLALASISLGAVAATAGLRLTRSEELFRPYFGSIDPLAVIALAIFVAVISLKTLRTREFLIYRQNEALKGMLVALLLATALAIPVIAVDFVTGINVVNVPLPWSLLFYPAIAFVVEAFFHALPLSLLVTIFVPALRQTKQHALIWACILLASLLEPSFQLGAGFSDQSRPLVDAYVLLQIWAVNLLQLCVFHRFGFVSMYVFRLVYYFWWHIFLGYLRLQLAS